MASDAADPNKRRTGRRRVLLTGIIAFANVSISFRCAIRDRSETGARVKLPDGRTTPDQFWLIDVNEGVAYEATISWRRPPEIGVALAGPISLRAPADGEIQHRLLRALWVEAAPRL